MIELPSAQQLCDRIAMEYEFVFSNISICSPQILESHMRVIHILNTKIKSKYAKANTDKKIFW